jgi:hypothetical protein
MVPALSQKPSFSFHEDHAWHYRHDTAYASRVTQARQQRVRWIIVPQHPKCR